MKYDLVRGQAIKFTQSVATPGFEEFYEHSNFIVPPLYKAQPFCSS